jgi:hypothetical protein
MNTEWWIGIGLRIALVVASIAFVIWNRGLSGKIGLELPFGIKVWVEARTHWISAAGQQWRGYADLISR